MKISNAEIHAANYALTELLEKPLDLAIMEHALIAALKVRRARKTAKRERQRKERDKPADDGGAECWQFHVKNGRVVRSSRIPSKALEWDGTFGCGEWETKSGEFAIVSEKNGAVLHGYIQSGNRICRMVWNENGGVRQMPPSGGDLIRPWPRDKPSSSTGEAG